MLRSFKLKFFLLVTISIVFFAIVTRISVRYASTKPLHEIFYGNFASYLELSLKDQSLSDLNTQAVQQKINAFYSDLNPNEAQVWLRDTGNTAQQNMLSGAVWRNIRNPSRTYAVELAELRLGESDWIVFKVPQGNQDFFVVGGQILTGFDGLL